MFLSVLSGRTGFISVGKEIPFTERWMILCRRYAHYHETVRFLTIDTGMEIRPVVAGDLAHIHIIPRISHMQRGEQGIIRFIEAQTRLTAPRGQWVSLGGHMQQSNDVIRQILAAGTRSNQSNMVLRIRADY
jgi:hypothetical protein